MQILNEIEKLKPLQQQILNSTILARCVISCYKSELLMHQNTIYQVTAPVNWETQCSSAKIYTCRIPSLFDAFRHIRKKEGRRFVFSKVCIYFQLQPWDHLQCLLFGYRARNRSVGSIAKAKTLGHPCFVNAHFQLCKKKKSNMKKTFYKCKEQKLHFLYQN